MQTRWRFSLWSAESYPCLHTKLSFLCRLELGDSAVPGLWKDGVANA
jgi:hypothetical protein